MNRENDAILAEAARWHVASEDDAMDWDGFTRWLEADPRHRSAYDEIALTDDLVVAHRVGLGDAFGQIAGDSRQDEITPAGSGDVIRIRFGRKWGWAATAIAATLAGVLAVPQFIDPAPKVYETAAGAQRIPLDDGSTVMLAPRSRLTVAGRDQDRMALSGGAMFDIRHDPDRQLTITAGDLRISDIGTRFDVQAQNAHVRVAVVEGRLQVSSDQLAAAVHLVAGRGLSFDGSEGTSQVVPVRPEDVGAWQQGRLSYDNAPLTLVVADLRRYAGVEVEVPANLRGRRFSGTLVIGNGDAALRDLAQVMGLRIGGRAGAWRLEQPAG